MPKPGVSQPVKSHSNQSLQPPAPASIRALTLTTNSNMSRKRAVCSFSVDTALLDCGSISGV